MKLNKSITNSKNNFGLTSLVGGVIQVFFGFNLNFVASSIFAITIGLALV